MIMIDSSHSVNQEDFKFALKFCENFINQKEIYLDSETGVRVEISQFSDIVEKIVEFSSDLDFIRTEFNSSKPISYNTNIDKALSWVIYNSIPKTRENSQKHLIFITDGKSDPKVEIKFIKNEADRLKNEFNVKIIAIGIGQSYSQDELSVIATSPEFIFHVDNFDLLDEITGTLASQICQPFYWVLGLPVVVFVLFYVVLVFLNWYEDRQLLKDIDDLGNMGSKVLGFVNTVEANAGPDLTSKC